jgi:hypothetical protein
MVPRALLTAAVVAAATAGCGSQSPTRLAPSAAATLKRQLSAVQANARSGNVAKALDALQAAAGTVAADARSGALTAGEQRALQTGIGRTRAALQKLAPPASSATSTSAPQTVTTTTTAAAPATPAPAAPAPAKPAPAPGPKPGHGPGGKGPPGKLKHDHGHGHDK